MIKRNNPKQQSACGIIRYSRSVLTYKDIPVYTVKVQL